MIQLEVAVDFSELGKASKPLTLPQPEHMASGMVSPGLSLDGIIESKPALGFFQPVFLYLTSITPRI